MKANAPERLYLSKTIYSTYLYQVPDPDDETAVEYTRTDAFIEKACEWIKTNMDDYIHVEYDAATGRPTNEAHIAHKKVVEDFKKYMNDKGDS